MKFWDSSAIIPLLVAEDTTTAVQAIVREDPEILVWWATEVECASALARLERQGDLDDVAALAAFERIDTLAGSWHEVQPVERTRRIARRLLRVHNLRAGDAFQLAAALVAGEEKPASLPFVSLDDKLTDAARREGFIVLEPGH